MGFLYHTNHLFSPDLFSCTLLPVIYGIYIHAEFDTHNFHMIYSYVIFYLHWFFMWLFTRFIYFHIYVFFPIYLSINVFTFFSHEFFSWLLSLLMIFSECDVSMFIYLIINFVTWLILSSIQDLIFQCDFFSSWFLEMIYWVLNDLFHMFQLYHMQYLLHEQFYLTCDFCTIFFYTQFDVCVCTWSPGMLHPAYWSWMTEWNVGFPNGIQSSDLLCEHTWIANLFFFNSIIEWVVNTRCLKEGY